MILSYLNCFIEKRDSLIFRSIPDCLKTLDVCFLFLEIDVNLLKFVPRRYYNLEFFKLVIEKNPLGLSSVPNFYKTYDLCHMACLLDGRSLFSVPHYLKTKELCMVAVRSNGLALKYVPDFLKTYEMCYMACQSHIMALDYISDAFITHEMCLIAVQKHKFSGSNFDGLALDAIPVKFRTFEIYKELCKRDGSMLSFVPSHMINLELCQIAIDSSQYALQHIPDHFIDKIKIGV